MIVIGALFMGILLAGGGIWVLRYLHERDEPKDFFAQWGKNILQGFLAPVSVFIGVMMLFGVLAGFIK